MSGIAHHLVKRGIEHTQDRYRTGSFAQDGDNKPFGHPHAVAVALVITSLLWFFALSAVSCTLDSPLGQNADADAAAARFNTSMAAW